MGFSSCRFTLPMIAWLTEPDDPLPDSRHALGPATEAPGLLAAGGELTPQRLAEAYGRGIFPWYGEGQPVLWWSPDPRMVLMVDRFKLSRSLRKTIARFVRSHDCEVRIDSAFSSVIEACAQAPRDGESGTWIVPPMIAAYERWHALGQVHSFETWIGGELVGGLYGVGLGGMFFGESMFARRSDASKIALAALVCFCRQHAIAMIDCQQRTSHLASLGAEQLTRADFERRLVAAVARPAVAEWTYHHSVWRHLGQLAEAVTGRQDDDS